MLFGLLLHQCMQLVKGVAVSGVDLANLVQMSLIVRRKLSIQPLDFCLQLDDGRLICLVHRQVAVGVDFDLRGRFSYTDLQSVDTDALRILECFRIFG